MVEPKSNKEAISTKKLMTRGGGFACLVLVVQAVIEETVLHHADAGLVLIVLPIVFVIAAGISFLCVCMRRFMYIPDFYVYLFPSVLYLTILLAAVAVQPASY